MKSVGLLVFAILFLCGSVYAGRTVWYVHPDSAINTIQAGLDSCADNDIVLVGPGTYYENIVWPNTQGTHLISELGPEMTIIDGDSTGTVISISTGVDTNTMIRGFSMQNGYDRGGIYCDSSSSPTITDNHVVGNLCGISCLNSSCPIIANNFINENWSDIFTGGDGSGILCINSNPTINNNIISGNSANTGGGVHCRDNANPTIINNIISGNTTWWFTVGGYGGGIYCQNSSPAIINNTITGNSTASCGGGVYCIYSSPVIVGNAITDNTGYSGAGIHCCNNSYPVIDSCTISDNYGDGIYCHSGGSPEIHHCNIHGNIGYGVCNVDAGITVNADSNWWGYATGPYHPTANPSGLGDSVSNYVDFDPWLSWPVGVEERLVAKPIDKQECISATIFRGPLQLPEGKKCRVFDIMGRVVEPSKMKPGVYFVEIDSSVTRKVIKIR